VKVGVADLTLGSPPKQVGDPYRRCISLAKTSTGSLAKPGNQLVFVSCDPAVSRTISMSLSMGCFCINQLHLDPTSLLRDEARGVAGRCEDAVVAGTARKSQRS